MIKDGFVEVGKGVNIYYKAIIKKQKWIVFLHGGTGTSASLRQQEDYFSNTDFSVLFIDFRGHGKSDRGKGRDFFRIAHLVKDVFQVFGALNIKDAVLVGHCVGSFVAQEFAEQHPEVLQGLVLVNSSIGMRRSLPVQVFLSSLFSSVRFLPIKGKREHPDYRKHFGSIDLSPARIYTDLIYAGAETYSQILLEAINYNPGAYRTFAGPVLIIHGKKDLFINPRQAAQLGKKYKNSEVMYLDTNHGIVINDAEKSNIAVHEFAKALDT